MVTEQLNDIIKTAKSILLVSHVNPDGDTLGSMCGMYSLVLDNFKKKSDMVAVSDVPVNYSFLPYSESIRHISQFDLSREYDLVINLDIASIDRCCDAKILFDRAKFTINIDHHETNSGYADIDMINPEAAATSEVLFELAKTYEWKISKNTAICLYTGVMTDTGSFRFSNTTRATMVCAGELISLGAEPAEIYQNCYESNSKDLVLFQNYCVNKAVFLEDGKIAYTTVYKKDLEKFNNKGEDFTDGLTEKLRAIRGTEIAFVVKETGASLTKVSMRSRTVSVADICTKFGGGGHKLAAGAVIKATPEQSIKMILKEIENLDLC